MQPAPRTRAASRRQLWRRRSRSFPSACRIVPEQGAAGSASSTRLCELQVHLVDIAPAPAFAGLERSDDWVLGRVEVLRRVLVLRVVAAADMAAGAAQAQVHPGVTHLQAFLAAVGAGPVGFDCAKMAATHPRYFLTVAASRSCACDGSRPNSRSARLCRSRSQ